MSRSGLRDLCASKRREADSGDRFIDLRVDLLSEVDGEALFSVGGRWDKRMKLYVGDAEKALVIRAHPGQIEAARWSARWLGAYARNEFLRTNVITAEGSEEEAPVFSALFAGGRRAGKTDLGAKVGIGFSVMVPKSRTWFVSESLPKTEELDEVILDMLPPQWYTRLGAPWFRYTFVNGSTLHLRSAHDPETLKRGRADFVLLNEAQNMSDRVYSIVRPAVGDTGGVVILAANPPDTAAGQWVADFYEETKARRRGSKLFEFDARKNPHIEVEALEEMKHEIDERTYRIEILGEFLARQDVVFYNWSPRDNIRPQPDTPDVTRAFTKRHLGREFSSFIGADFQLSPHMAGAIFKAWPDPDDPRDVLLWIVDEAIVENGDENDLIDALEGRGMVGTDVAVIADASGEWQDAKRTVGRGSYDIFRRRGWRNIYTPDRNSKKNPLILERCAVGNVRMRTSDGKRHLFSAPDNFYTNRALRLWENKNGVPHRKSQHAHVSDAVTYPLWRFYPRKLKAGAVAVATFARERGGGGARRQTSRARDLAGY